MHTPLAHTHTRTRTHSHTRCRMQSSTCKPTSLFVLDVQQFSSRSPLSVSRVLPAFACPSVGARAQKHSV
jgi:hypothetical protein